MSSSEALTYYAQEFGNPTTIYKAESVSLALLWISAIGLGLMVLLTLCAGFTTRGGSEAPGATLGLIGLCSLGLRVCWIVTIPIVFHRINVSFDIASENLLILDDQKSFSQYANSCGDPLNAMNIEKANTFMYTASHVVNQAWAFSLSCIILLCVELAFPCCIILLKNCNCGGSQYSRASDKVLIEDNYSYE